MNYNEAITYLLEQADLERDPSRRQTEHAFHIERMTSLLERLGRPDAGRLTVHVAGSKGKGSTASMIAAILRASGLRTGLYTSPHLHSFSERIAVDGVPVDESEFAALASRLRPAAEDEGGGTYGRVTTFEHLTAMAFLHFAAAGCAAQVIEVGLGGRLDATNALSHKDICVITPISLEHTEILGGTVELIAAEKAGIFCCGATAVVAPQRYAGAHEVLVGQARALGMPVVDTQAMYGWQHTGDNDAGQRLEIRTPTGRYTPNLPLLGTHQVENAVTAIAAAEALVARGAVIDATAIEDGLAAVRWPGRLEVAGRDPWLILDGAHNGDSASRLRESLAAHFPFDRLTVIIGVGRDKDVAAIATELGPAADLVICTQSSHPRAAPAAEVAPAFAALGVRTEVLPDLGEALRSARAEARPGDLICVMGSLFVVADARDIVFNTPLTAGHAY